MPRHLSPTHDRPRRGLPRWLQVTLVTVLAVACLTVAGVWWVVRSAEEAFRVNAVALEGVVGELAQTSGGDDEPLYFLVIGSDSREGVDTSQFGDFGGARSDVVMVARVDRAAGFAQLLSIPRDTIVPIEGHGDDKVNAAYAYGGAPLMVRTVRNAFDLPIHHYVEVGLAGFQDLVDELGGVEMNFEHAARDAKSHLDVPAGRVTLDGFQALAYARSRTYQELRDGAWVSVEASDIGRTERQQRLVLAILDAMRRPATLTEPGPVVASIAQHMTVDAALADSSLVDLALSMREIGPSDIEMATLPTTGGHMGAASVQLVSQPQADGVLAALRSGRPMDTPVTDGIVAIEILNGNGVVGNAAEWASHLTVAGYQVATVANSDRPVDVTLVLIRDGTQGSAGALVSRLGFGVIQVGTVPEDVDAVVILGSDAG